MLALTVLGHSAGQSTTRYVPTYQRGIHEVPQWETDIWLATGARSRTKSLPDKEQLVELAQFSQHISMDVHNT